MTVLENNIDKNTINIIMTLLFRDEKKVIKLKHGFEGQEYSFSEIAEILNLPCKQSAYQYYKQGITAIRKALRIAS